MERSLFGSASNWVRSSQSLSMSSWRESLATLANCFSRKSSQRCSTGPPFWTVGGLEDQANILRDLESGSLMLGGLIHLHDKKVVCEGRGNMGEEHIHHRGISPGQDQRDHFPFRSRHSRIHIGELAHDLPGRVRANARRHPGPPGPTSAAKAPFILSHEQHGPLISRITRG